MAIKKSELYSSLWSSCDELRGSMDPSQYKDYVLVLLFVKYVSDKYAGLPFAPIAVPPGASFADMVELKGKPDIGELINKKIMAPLANANKLSDVPDFDDVVDYSHLKFAIVKPQLVVTGEREFKDLAEQEAFMQDRLVIMIHRSGDKRQPRLVPAGLNGDQVFLPRGVKVRVPRGIVGSLLTGVLVSGTISGASGNLLAQSVAVVAVAAFSFAATCVLMWLTDRLVGVRVDAQAQQQGLDISEHREHVGT